MRLNAEFSQRATVHFNDSSWRPSPISGVDRHILDRVGDEVARATSIVRYAPGSKFSPHVHGGGEEFLVLEGVFQDEHGDCPAGAYIRNPPESSHTPRSEPGCIIFVKLRQFDLNDRLHVRLDTNTMRFQPDPTRNGVAVLRLHTDKREDVRLEQWSPNVSVDLVAPRGLEALVLDGSFVETGEAFSRYSWLRLPPGATLKAISGPLGCKLWVKSGHLVL